MPGRASAMVPPQDIPDGKKSIERPATRSAQRDASAASTVTSLGRRRMRPVAPERIDALGRVDDRRDLGVPAQRRAAVGLEDRQRFRPRGFRAGRASSIAESPAG